MKNRMALLATVALLVAVLVVVGGAAGPSKPKLSFTKSSAQIGWSSEGGSSPLGGVSNANTQSLRINVTGVTGSAGASAYTYGPDEELVGIRGLKLSQITHLGFDSKGYLGAGAPRISLGTLGNDGAHTYFLAAMHCNTAIGSDWRTSDFVHQSTNCTIFRDSTPIAGWAAAAAIADANNETVISNANDWFLIVDEGPSLSYIDRLTVNNWCWTGNGGNGTINVNSGDCVGN